MKLSTLGTVSTRSLGMPGSMSRDISPAMLRSVKRIDAGSAEDSGQAQGGKRVIGQRVVVDHVGPRRRRPCQLGEVQPGLLFGDIGGLERLLRGLDGVG